MPLNIYIVVFLTGAAALALWVDARWPQLRPGLSAKLLAHLIASTVLAQLHTHHLLLVLAILTYVLLVALWAFRALLGAMGNNSGGGLPANK